MRHIELKKYPDPCLRIKTKPVEEFDSDLKNTLRMMADIMYDSSGIGLAATQVGLGMSVLVIDTGEGLINFINPVVLEHSKRKSSMEEGCLSLPNITVNVKRPEEIKVRAQNENGDFFIKKYDGIMAKALQHEMDHLEGKLIINYLDPIRYVFATRKLSKVSEEEIKTCEVICNVREKDNR